MLDTFNEDFDEELIRIITDDDNDDGDSLIEPQPQTPRGQPPYEKRLQLRRKVWPLICKGSISNKLERDHIRLFCLSQVPRLKEN